MSLQAYKDHPLHGTLTRLNEITDDPVFSDSSLFSDDTASFNRDKVLDLTKFLRLMVDGTPASLSSFAALNNINSNLQSVVSELTAFISNKNTGHLANAASYFENNILPHTWGFASLGRNLPKKEVAEFVNTLNDKSHSTISSLEEKRLELDEKIREANEELKRLSARLEEQQNSLSSLTQASDSTLGTLQAAYETKESERSGAFEARISTYNKNISRISSDLEENSEILLAELASYRDQAARIVQSVGTIGITGNYKNIADSESKSANRWRLVTLAIFACGIGLAIATFVRFYHEPINAQNIWAIAVRLMYALAIAAPAFYTARESARHRTNSDRARQTELELASLGPFIELMDAAQKEEIRRGLVPKYFGNTVEAHDVKSTLDTSQLIDLIKGLK